MLRCERSDVSTPTVLVTAAAFRADAPESEQPFVRAGVRILYPARMGPLSPAELTPLLPNVDGIIAAVDPYNDATLGHAARLRVIARWGTGFDSVDVAACTRHGVMACNAPQLNVEAVADHTVMTMLALTRRLEYQLRVARQGGWEEVRGGELFRKRVGIVGFGAIGRAVARRLRGFECRVLAYDPHVPPAAAAELGVELADLDRVCAESDFLTVHAALTPETRHLVDARRLALLPRGAFLINAARGGIVDEAALLPLLTAGSLGGAAIDAFETEPLPADHPFRGLQNCLVTTHSAFNTVETAKAVNKMVARQVLDALRSRIPPHLLNPDVVEQSWWRSRKALIPDSEG